MDRIQIINKIIGQSIGRVKYPAFILFVGVMFFISSCGPTKQVGQNDIDRIHQNEKQFNSDMQSTFNFADSKGRK